MILAALQTFSNISELARFSERYFFRNRGGKMAGQISPSAIPEERDRRYCIAIADLVGCVPRTICI
jgi:hypothetical protein